MNFFIEVSGRDQVYAGLNFLSLLWTSLCNIEPIVICRNFPLKSLELGISFVKWVLIICSILFNK